MSRNNNDGEALLVVGLIVLGFAGLGVSNFFGVPFLEGLKILPKLLVWLVLFGGVTYFGYLRPLLPLSVASLWLCFLPILDYKAGIRDDSFNFQPEIAWYGTASVQGLVFFLILILGYGLMIWLRSRYRY